MPEVIRVGMGECAVARAPGEIATLGLGSCVAVCMYDPAIKLGALAHVMLPDSRAAKDAGNPTKFADTAVPFMFQEMEKSGANRTRLIVKIVGGAHMFSGAGKEREGIGLRNIAAIEEALSKVGLPPSGKSVGGNCGKSVTLDLETGELRLRTIQVESARL